jgi:hypothetical protein
MVNTNFIVVIVISLILIIGLSVMLLLEFQQISPDMWVGNNTHIETAQPFHSLQIDQDFDFLWHRNCYVLVHILPVLY